MKEKVMKIGILSKEEYKKRTISIAKGEYKPEPDEPKVWFESLKSMAQVLSHENQELLQIILEQNPDSIKELEGVTGRKSSNLSRTLKTLARYGIVELSRKDKAVKPVVKATDFEIEFGLHRHFPKAEPRQGEKQAEDTRAVHE